MDVQWNKMLHWFFLECKASVIDVWQLERERKRATDRKEQGIFPTGTILILENYLVSHHLFPSVEINKGWSNQFAAPEGFGKIIMAE